MLLLSLPDSFHQPLTLEAHCEPPTEHIPLPCNNVLPNASEDFQVVLIMSDVPLIMFLLPAQTALSGSSCGYSTLMVRGTVLAHVFY